MPCHRRRGGVARATTAPDADAKDHRGGATRLLEYLLHPIMDIALEEQESALTSPTIIVTHTDDLSQSPRDHVHLAADKPEW